MPDANACKTNSKTSASLMQTTCAYCGVGCGIDIQLENQQPKSLQGTPEHPANYGRLCVKGTHLLETHTPENRLLQPMVSGSNVSWSQAIATTATQLQNIISEHGPNAVAFYVSGQLLTEDYYVANKLMKGYIGSGNIDTNSRLCMSSAVAAYKRSLGEDVVPCSYNDLEQADLLVLTGSNAAWTHPVLYQRIERAKQMNPTLQVIVIDPRRTATTALADQFLQIRPGADAALFCGLLHHLQQQNALDEAFIQAHTSDFALALEACSDWDLDSVAQFCRLSRAELKQFYAAFTKNKRVMTLYSMGINQSSTGVDKCNAIINCHLATGTIGREGCGPFSLTGQPNAMGGREVGGLANQLAAHMDIDNPQHRERVQRFWNSPAMAQTGGLKAVDLFDAMAEGKVKAIWIMATNPMVSLPERQKIAAALEACELVIVSDCVNNSDTLAYADIALPASGWLEKNGTVTNSERRISRQRGVVAPPGDAKHDWQIICAVAQAMGFDGFDYRHPAEIFCEHAALTGFENNGERLLDLSGIAKLNQAEYDALKPVQWPVNAVYPQGCDQLLADGRFPTSTGKARFIPIQPQLPQLASCSKYPLILNSGRYRDQWHTMTRTGRYAGLLQHAPKPVLNLHPTDAATYGLQAGQLAKINSRSGSVTLHVEVSEHVAQGEAFVPIHWNQQFASSANISNLYAAIFDPISGQPESKQTPVAVTPASHALQVQLYCAQPQQLTTKQIQQKATFW